jgi:uncharacterized protein YkwD
MADDVRVLVTGQGVRDHRTIMRTRPMRGSDRLRRTANGARVKSPRRVLAIIGAATLVAGLALGFATAASASGDGEQNAQTTELVRLLNGERAYHGLAPLSVDPFLTTKATDGDVACPNDPVLVAHGRAKDIALNGWVGESVHYLRLCPTYSALDTAQVLWGYNTNVGEIYAWDYASDTANSDPSTAYNYRLPYTYGCGDDVWNDCPGATTWSYRTSEIAAAGWMSSPGHRANVLGDYDRIGCGGWSSPDTTRHFICIFANGGPNEIVAPPPEVPLPTPSPTPTPVSTPIPDETAPAVTSLTASTVVTTTNRSFVAAWGATDNEAVTGYEVWLRRGSGTWSEQPFQTTTSKTFSGLSAGTWHVGVRARDAAGNWSTFRQTAVLLPTDDRAWTFSAGNTRRKGSNFVKGTDTTTRRSGARMTIRFSGSSFVLIGTAAVNHGRLRVVIDGRAYTVDEGYYKGARATTTHYRVILLNKSLTNRTHTVVVTCLGTSGRPTIDVDAVAWRN